MNNLKYLIISILFVLTSSVGNKLCAQDKSSVADDTRQDATIVIGTVLGGAILGLSTLSFVDKPKEHGKNITVGAAIGTIIGVAIVAWKQGTRSQGMYQEAAGEASNYVPHKFDTLTRTAWHNTSFERNLNSASTEKPSFLISFSY